MPNLAPLVNAWHNAIKAADKARSPFMETANICNHFYSGSVGFMWNSSFRDQYLNNLPDSKFHITIAKAFELVSIVGPTLMWSNPGRVVTSYEKLEIPPEFWGPPEDPNAQQMGTQWLQEYERDMAVSKTRNALMQHYLNYSQREQPGGGLRFDSQLGVIDMLIKGRGCIQVGTYNHGDTDKVLTGGFFLPVENLFVDPDCDRGNWSNARWIAVRHAEPHWKVERRFGWPAGSLRGKASMTSPTAAATAGDGMKNGTFRKVSDVNDILVWFEVFSKCGVGTRFKEKPLSAYHAAFEESVGDNAYICFVPGMNEFLNMRSSFLEEAMTDQVGAALDWPIPYYKDGRWPVAPLDVWHQPGSAWPLAPLAMGLGELIFMNVFISSLADRIFQDGLSKACVKQELADEAVEKLLSYKHEVLEINPNVAGNINELVSFLQRPQVNFDAFRMLEYVSMMFDKRVGLMELMYGLNPGGKVSRTAADANIKGDAVSVRPEFMAAQVESWQTEIANLERIAAGYSVSAQTVAPLFGNTGAQLWDQLITQADPEVYMLEMRSRVEANSIRKPNKSRDNQNIQQMSGYMLPMLQWFVGATGNTEPLNEYLKSMGRAMDQEVDGWLMPPIQPQGPSPEEMEAEQEAAELEKAEKQSKLTGRELQNLKTKHEMLVEGIGQPMDVLMNEVEVDPDLMEQRPIA